MDHSAAKETDLTLTRAKKRVKPKKQGLHLNFHEKSLLTFFFTIFLGIDQYVICKQEAQ